ncbi:hypothetical protein [Helicovermis profundi]|uniref:Uncharacterized protein n=1 Tax=Helicovermis profundi TaxID=3065157 RepID=A0AAU9ECC2_9FIRM|nr:hypothetical protein HLPR_13300 [Clostridia bacterium S502]
MKKIKINKWIIRVTLLTFVLAILMSIVSENLLRNLNIFFASVILIVIIGIGVLFDTIGIAVTAADLKPFNSMAAKKIMSAKFSLKLLNNASQVSNFCNDVIGDISGIVSGSAVAIIVLKILYYSKSSNEIIYSILLSGFVAALTVGGKAFGKEMAITNSKEIVGFVGKILYLIYKKTGFEIYKKD